MPHAASPDRIVIETVDFHPNHAHWKCKNCGARESLISGLCGFCGVEIDTNAWVITETGEIFGQICGWNYEGLPIWRYVLKPDGHVPDDDGHFCGGCYPCIDSRKYRLILGREKP
jgi:hypothetical protein